MDRKGFYGWKIVFAVFITMMTIYPPIVNSISIFTNPVTKDLGFMSSSFLMYFTIMSFSSVLTNSFVGVLLRKYKANYIMAAGAILVALSLMGFSRSTKLLHFYLLAAVQGAGLSASCIVPPSVLVTNWFNEKRGLALGLALAGAGIGGGLFSPLATSLILSQGWRMAYFVSGLIILLVTLPIIFFFIRFEPSLLGQEPLGGLPEMSGKSLGGQSYGEMVKSSSFYVMILSILLGGILVNGLLVNFSPYIQFMGYTPQQGSLILSFSLLFMTLGKMILGRLFDKAGPQITFLAILGSSLLCVTSLILARNFAFGILYTVSFGLASANALVTPAILTTLLFGQKEFSKKYGFVATFVALSAAITPIYTGFFTKSGEGGYTLMLYSFLGIAALTYITLVLSVKLKAKN